jgi:hypothetical protein
MVCSLNGGIGRRTSKNGCRRSSSAIYQLGAILSAYQVTIENVAAVISTSTQDHAVKHRLAVLSSKTSRLSYSNREKRKINNVNRTE